MTQERSISDVKAAKEANADHLRSLPNVRGLGVGHKVRRGVTTGELAIKVYVSRKLPLSTLAPDERIPESLDGIPTDVELMAPMRARAEEDDGERT